MRGATKILKKNDCYLVFLLTHLLRGATKTETWESIHSDISTHAPLARCNYCFRLSRFLGLNFYSRTSCEVQRRRIIHIRLLLHFYSRTSCEVQHLVGMLGRYVTKFLLTHLLRGATSPFLPLLKPRFYFYSRTSCEVQHKKDDIIIV